LREVAGGMFLSGKEETVRINHLPKKEHFVGRKQM
jgi:hypothetical protein